MANSPIEAIHERIWQGRITTFIILGTESFHGISQILDRIAEGTRVTKADGIGKIGHGLDELLQFRRLLRHRLPFIIITKRLDAAETNEFFCTGDEVE